jgi:dTDP-4-dehydrorhamnose reductase
MRVFVLGHNGMLGHVVARYLTEQGFHVLTTEARYSGSPNDALIQAVRKSDADWIINAIGKLPRNCSNDNEMLLVNAILPVHLRSFLKEKQRMIHASSNGVFSGKRGDYRTTDERDAQDSYGLSKILGEIVAEPGRCWVIRTSTIGPEKSGHKGLLDWFLSQKTPVNGYTNDFWNGLTTLEWAKLCTEIMEGRFSNCGLVQTGASEKISKFELLQILAEIWTQPAGVRPVARVDRLDRTVISEFQRSPIKQQIRELREWY